MQRLTEAEKQARGTARKYRALKPRTQKIIRQELADIQQCMTDMQHNLTEAGKQIRERGMFIKVNVTDNNGTLREVEKLNPAFKVQKEALSALRSLKRHLTMLREEESLAGVKEQQANESSEFERPTD